MAEDKGFIENMLTRDQPVEQEDTTINLEIFAQNKINNKIAGLPPEGVDQSKHDPFKYLFNPTFKADDTPNWLNMDAIHMNESSRGKDKSIYKKDGSYYLRPGTKNNDPAFGEYQIKASTFREPGSGLESFGATTIEDPMNASVAEHREFAKNYIVALEKHFRKYYALKEKANPGLLDYPALAIASYSRGIGTIKGYVKEHGSIKWREHVEYDKVKGDKPGGYLYKYNDYNTKNKTGHKQVQREVNNEDLA